jgi:ATP-dependent Clp protease ATP-binding subunit ClpA
VGKTETVRIFTEHLFGEENKLVRLDMSEYMTLDSIEPLLDRSIHDLSGMDSLS